MRFTDYLTEKKKSKKVTISPFDKFRKGVLKRGDKELKKKGDKEEEKWFAKGAEHEEAKKGKIAMFKRGMKEDELVEDASMRDYIMKTSKKQKFRFKIQGTNVYLQSAVDIDKVKAELARQIPFKVRFRDKTQANDRIYMHVDVARDDGSHGYMFTFWFDGNKL